MPNDTLSSCIIDLRKYWSGLNSNTIIRCREVLTRLAATSISEHWLAELHERRAAATELYRDSEQGFILLAHVEPYDLYRDPHNHGNGWVFYALQYGEVQMSTYGAVGGEGAEGQLISRGAYIMTPGECSVFLPGDIHDTRCVSEYSLMFRLTSCDFSEEKRRGRLQKYNTAKQCPD
ncbi:hypothetical protein [Microbulbifer epialgicus]|uniref:Cysteine dioxygenase type I n=1 Tax=Microbulbifer epialgicus TaxID=393907 RepID=A0ABV4P0N4_9GAMM